MKTENEITEIREEAGKILANPETTPETIKYYQGFLGALDWYVSKKVEEKKEE